MTELGSLDLTGDGVADQWFTDTSGDGVVDEAAADADGDGAADLWVLDRDDDGVTDAALTDRDRDGHHEMVPGVPLNTQTVAGAPISFDSDGGTGTSGTTPSGQGGGTSSTPYLPDSTSYDDTADPDGDGRPNTVDSSDHDPYDTCTGDADDDGEPDALDQDPTQPEPYENAD